MEGGNGNGGSGGHSREYCLRWNNHQPNMVSFLSTLLPKESFADVTLVSAEGSKIQAHRIILSACSPYFEGVFESNPCKHPVVILKDVQFVDLRAIVNFIYNGEVNIEVDRINEIIQTATALQVKGLAEVPADEFKRVSLGGRCSTPVESPPAPAARAQPPPPLIMSSSSIRSWPPSADASENINDFPVRKKLKKSASANIPYSSGSSSTNGDATNSTGSSFESGMGTSVSRSVDEGIGSDISSNDQPQTSVRPGPPPLTAANALLPKSRSLDDGYQRGKNANNVDVDASGYVEHGLDDNGLGQDGGYDGIDGVVDASVKMEHHAAAVAYLEASGLDMMDDEDQVDMTAYYDEDGDQYEGSEIYSSPKQETFERPLVPLRKLLPKSKLKRRNNNNNNNSNNNGNANMHVGVGHSLSLYRQQPLKNLASRNSVGGGIGSFKGEVERTPRRKTSRNYLEPQFKEKFQEAVKLVTTGKASILKAAKICEIPKSTLYLRLREMGISSSETPYQQNQQLQNGTTPRRGHRETTSGTALTPTTPNQAT